MHPEVIQNYLFGIRAQFWLNNWNDFSINLRFLIHIAFSSSNDDPSHELHEAQRQNIDLPLPKI